MQANGNGARGPPEEFLNAPLYASPAPVRNERGLYAAAQPHPSPRHARRASIRTTGTAASAAALSTQVMCQTAFAASPANVTAARYAQVADWVASARRAASPVVRAYLRFIHASSGMKT